MQRCRKRKTGDRVRREEEHEYNWKNELHGVHRLVIGNAPNNVGGTGKLFSRSGKPAHWLGLSADAVKQERGREINVPKNRCGWNKISKQKPAKSEKRFVTERFGAKTDIDSTATDLWKPVQQVTVASISRTLVDVLHTRTLDRVWTMDIIMVFEMKERAAR